MGRAKRKEKESILKARVLGIKKVKIMSKHTNYKGYKKELEKRCQQLQKDRDSDMFSFAKCVARVLKGYITNGASASEKICSECKAEGLVYVEGCITCKACGYAKCG